VVTNKGDQKSILLTHELLLARTELQYANAVSTWNGWKVAWSRAQ